MNEMLVNCNDKDYTAHPHGYHLKWETMQNLIGMALEFVEQLAAVSHVADHVIKMIKDFLQKINRNCRDDR